MNDDLECKLSEKAGAFWEEEKQGSERRLYSEDELTVVAIEVDDDCEYVLAVTAVCFVDFDDPFFHLGLI